MRKKIKTTRNVIVIDGDRKVRRQLMDYLKSNAYRLLYECGKAGRAKVYQAESILKAKEKIKITLDFCLVIFSDEFPQEERDELRNELSYHQQAIDFVIVPRLVL